MELAHEDLAVQPPGGRVLYRCVDATATLVAFGANTGSVYMHAASTLKLLVIIPVSSTDISHVLFSPSGELLAASSGRQLFVIRHNAENSRDSAVTLLSLTQHEQPITALAWDSTVPRVFSGSEDGLVTAAKVPTSRSMVLQDDPSYRTDSTVVQLSYRDERLLVSSLTRAIVIHLPKRTSNTIGQQARNGHYGAIWAPGGGLVLYAARPRGRMWRADGLACTVQATLQMPDAPLGVLLPIGAWIAGYGARGLAIIDTAARAVVAACRLPVLDAAFVPGSPHILALSPGGPMRLLLPAVPPPPLPSLPSAADSGAAVLVRAGSTGAAAAPAAPTVAPVSVAAAAAAAGGAVAGSPASGPGAALSGSPQGDAVLSSSAAAASHGAPDSAPDSLAGTPPPAAAPMGDTGTAAAAAPGPRPAQPPAPIDPQGDAAPPPPPPPSSASPVSTLPAPVAAAALVAAESAPVAAPERRADSLAAGPHPGSPPPPGAIDAAAAPPPEAPAVSVTPPAADGPVPAAVVPPAPAPALARPPRTPSVLEAVRPALDAAREAAAAVLRPLGSSPPVAGPTPPAPRPHKRTHSQPPSLGSELLSALPDTLSALLMRTGSLGSAAAAARSEAEPSGAVPVPRGPAPPDATTAAAATPDSGSTGRSTPPKVGSLQAGPAAAAAAAAAVSVSPASPGPVPGESPGAAPPPSPARTAAPPLPPRPTLTPQRWLELGPGDGEPELVLAARRALAGVYGVHPLLPETVDPLCRAQLAAWVSAAARADGAVLGRIPSAVVLALLDAAIRTAALSSDAEAAALLIALGPLACSRVTARAAAARAWPRTLLAAGGLPALLAFTDDSAAAAADSDSGAAASDGGGGGGGQVAAAAADGVSPGDPEALAGQYPAVPPAAVLPLLAAHSPAAAERYLDTLFAPYLASAGGGDVAGAGAGPAADPEAVLLLVESLLRRGTPPSPTDLFLDTESAPAEPHTAALPLAPPPPAFLLPPHPRPGAHLLPWPREHELLRIVSCPHVFALDAPRLERMLAAAGCYAVLLELLHTAQRWPRGLALSCALGDVPWMRRFLPAADAPDADDAAWLTALRVAAEARQHGAPADAATRAALAAVDALGVRAAVLLRDQEPLLTALGPEVLAALMRCVDETAARLELRRQLLEAADAFLWAHRPAPLPASTAAAVLAAAAAAAAGDSAPAAFGARMEQDAWGVEVTMARSVCVCGVQLLAPVGPSLTAFDCGHAFHTRCVAEGICPVCVQSEFVLL